MSGVAVVHAIPVNSEGKILIQQRAAVKRIWPGRWALLGGHVEAGESTEQALLREFWEEYGIDAAGAPRQMLLRMEHPVARREMEYWLLRIDVSLADVVCQPGEVDAVAIVSPAELYEMYAGDGRWAAEEQQAREQVLGLLARLPALIAGNSVTPPPGRS